MCFKIAYVLEGILLLVVSFLGCNDDYFKLGSVTSFVESGWFTALFFGAIMAFLLLIKFSKIEIKNLKVKRDIFLAVISALVALSFFACISTYYNAKSIYDFEWQPVMMAALSILSCLTFVIMTITLLTGKNLFSFLSFFIYCPVFWYAFQLILFLSVQNDNSNIYDITLTAFSALFFLYYTQVFSTSSNLNIVKLIIGFGAATVILTAMKTTNYYNMIKGSSVVNEVESTTLNLQDMIAIYIFFVVIYAYGEIRKSKISSGNDSQKI